MKKKQPKNNKDVVVMPDTAGTEIIDILKREENPTLHQHLDKLFSNVEDMSREETKEMWVILHFAVIKEVKNILSANTNYNSDQPEETVSLSVISEHDVETVPKDPENIQNTSTSLEFIHAIGQLITKTIAPLKENNNNKSSISKPMADIMYILPKLLVPAYISSEDKNKIIRLIELWVAKKLTCKLSMCIFSLKFLLELTGANQKDVQKSDIHRVWMFRRTLVDKNLQNNGTLEFRQLVGLACSLTKNEHYMKSKDGCNFIAFLFTLHRELTLKLHKSVKQVLPTISQQRASDFGEIYVTAWLQASVEMRVVIEELCIQNYMTHACILQRRGTEMSKVGANVFNILHHFHIQRTHPILLKMLADRYEPIIWRFLVSSNNKHRCNAAQVFFDSYPLQRPGSGAMQRSMYEEKQHQMIHDLLLDNCPIVRIIAIGGISKLMKQYWMSLEHTWIEKWMNTLVVTLAVDSSSYMVRRQVFLGLAIIFENVNARKVVQDAVTLLKLQLHDTKEPVRKAFVNLLCKMKDAGEMFWHFVPLPHLLARLTVEKMPIGSRLVNLLFKSFCSPTKTDDVVIKRLMILIHMNPNASRNFFQYSKSSMPMADGVKLMISILLFLHTHVKNCIDPDKVLESPSEVRRVPELRSKKRQNGEDKENVNTQNVPEDNGEKSGDILHKMSLENPRIMQGFVDIVVILWILHSKEIVAAPDKESQLHKLTKFCIPPFLLYYKDSEIYPSLLHLASLVPVSIINQSCHVTSIVFSQLKKLTTDDDEDKLVTYIHPLCAWNRGSDVIELAQEWLHDAFTADDACAARNRTKRNRIAFNLPQDPKPEVALNFLDIVLKWQLKLKAGVCKNHDKLLTLWMELDYIKELITERLVRNEPLDNKLLNDAVLRRCLLRYAKLIPNLRNDEFDPCEHYSALLLWARESVLVFLPDELPDISVADVPLTIAILRDLVQIGKDTILIDNNDPGFCMCVAAFVKKLLTTGCSLMFVNEAMSVATALCETVKVMAPIDKSFKNFLSVVVPSLLIATLSTVSSASEIILKDIEGLQKMTRLKNMMYRVIKAIDGAYGTKCTLLERILEEFSDVFVNQQVKFMEQPTPANLYKQLVNLFHEIHLNHESSEMCRFDSRLGVSTRSDETVLTNVESKLPYLTLLLISIFTSQTVLGSVFIKVIGKRMTTKYSKDESLRAACESLLTALLLHPGKLVTKDIQLALQSPDKETTCSLPPTVGLTRTANKENADHPPPDLYSYRGENLLYLSC